MTRRPPRLAPWLLLAGLAACSAPVGSANDDDSSDDDSSDDDDDSSDDDDSGPDDDDSASDDDDSAASTCEDDALEENDSEATAVPIESGSWGGLVCCPGDNDWYRVALSTGQTLEVSLVFLHEQGDIDLKVYDSAGEEVGSSTSVTNNEALSLSVASEGEHLIRILLFADTGSSVLGNVYDMNIAVQ